MPQEGAYYSFSRDWVKVLKKERVIKRKKSRVSLKKSSRDLINTFLKS